MSRTKTVYARNLFTTLGILLLSFILLGVSFASITYNTTLQTERINMVGTANEASHVMVATEKAWGVESLWMRMYLSSLSEASGYRILISDAEGTVVSCSDSELNCRHIGRYIGQDVLGLVTETGKFFPRTDFSGVYGESCFVVGIKITQIDADDPYYIFVSSTRDVMVGGWRQFSWTFIAIAVTVMFVATVATLYTTKKLTRPLDEMAKAAHRFAKGDFSVRVDERGDTDEIGQLADAFNVMADSLERAEKERRELIANVSHELKTPMTTITGFADGILDGTIPRDKQDSYLRTISSEAKRLSRLVRGMLDISQLQSADTTKARSGSFDAAEVVRVTLLSLEKKITDRKLDVDLHLPEENIVVRGDQDAIMQVMYNLIENAAKFADEGTCLVIELWKQGPKAYFSVEDTGQTIPREELPLVFDRFHKTDKSRSMDRDGVGLGLYIVKTIIDSHNEDVFVTSEDGKTKFSFSMTLKN